VHGGRPEWTYDQGSHLAKFGEPLAEGRTGGWVVIDIKADWKIMYPPER
jgi:hypothetical protein